MCARVFDGGAKKVKGGPGPTKSIRRPSGLFCGIPECVMCAVDASVLLGVSAPPICPGEGGRRLGRCRSPVSIRRHGSAGTKNMTGELFVTSACCTNCIRIPCTLLSIAVACLCTAVSSQIRSCKMHRRMPAQAAWQPLRAYRSRHGRDDHAIRAAGS